VVQTIEYDSPKALFVGLAFSPDGTKAYAGGGGQQVVHAYDVRGTGDDAHLTETTPYPLPRTNPAGQPPYTAVVHGSTAYVSNQGATTVSVLDIGGATPTVTRTIEVGTHPNAE